MKSANSKNARKLPPKKFSVGLSTDFILMSLYLTLPRLKILSFGS
jgi:hypothetical protein